LIVCAIIFGLLIILVHNKFAKSIALQKDKVEKG
jgi:hypothetical protein